MLIFALDDEALLLETLRRTIEQAEPGAEVYTFDRASKALSAIREDGLRPDVAFLDIEMPGMTGIALAKRIKDLSGKTNIIFVTGFSHYAAEAMTLYPSGYVMKPVTAERIRRELDNLRYPVTPRQEKRLQFRCFGNFEVFHENEPLHFKRSKTKELLAYLTDRQGAMCTMGELIGVLWEDRPSTPSLRSNMRGIIHDLRSVLEEIEAGDVVIRQRNAIALNVEKVDCDYYNYLRYDPVAVNMYYGEYMMQYSWAEMTTAALDSASRR